MEWAEVIGAIIAALIVGAIFYYGFKSTGPWGTFWSFILVLFLIIWLFAAIAEPYGPVYWGIAWLDFLIIGVLFALLLAAATPSEADRARYRDYYTSKPTTTTPEDEYATTAVALSAWFWFMIILFLIIAVFAAIF